MVDQGLSLIPAILGILKAGRIYVPLEAGAGPRAARLHAAGLLRAPRVVTASAMSLVRDVAGPDLAPHRHRRAPARTTPPSRRRSRSRADAPAYIYYTTGSTGRAEGRGGFAPQRAPQRDALHERSRASAAERSAHAAPVAELQRRGVQHVLRAAQRRDVAAVRRSRSRAAETWPTTSTTRESRSITRFRPSSAASCGAIGCSLASASSGWKAIGPRAWTSSCSAALLSRLRPGQRTRRHRDRHRASVPLGRDTPLEREIVPSAIRSTTWRSRCSTRTARRPRPARSGDRGAQRVPRPRLLEPPGSHRAARSRPTRRAGGPTGPVISAASEPTAVSSIWAARTRAPRFAASPCPSPRSRPRSRRCRSSARPRWSRGPTRATRAA